MAVRALAANNEVVVNNETYVTSNLALQARVYLPKINDGTGATVAVGKEIRFDSLGTGSIEIVTLGGSRVGLVPSRTSACVVARSGQVQGERDQDADHQGAEYQGPSLRSPQSERQQVAERGEEDQEEKQFENQCPQVGLLQAFARLR